MSDDESVTALGVERAESSTSVRPKQSRGERKARKLLLKGHEKCIDNVSRVVLRQSDGSMYVIDNPEVFKHAKGDTFLVFGEVTIANANQLQAEKAALEINTNIAAAAAKEKPTPIETISDGDGDDDVAEIDETGLEALDIELVMNQANVSRRMAVLALRENDNDLVNTIMNLTK